MNDEEKNPNTQNIENVDDGLDDDLDVPTYRKLADDSADAADNTSAGNAVAGTRDVEPNNAETEILAADNAPAGSASAVSTDDLPNSADTNPRMEAVTALDAEDLVDAGLDDSSTAASATAASGGAASGGAAASDETQMLDKHDATSKSDSEKARRGDPYRAAGRAAPQVIAPLAAAKNYREADADFADSTAADDLEATQVAPAAGSHDGDDAPTEMYDASDNSRVDGDDNATSVMSGALAAGAAGAGATAVGASALGDRDGDDTRDLDRDRDRDRDLNRDLDTDRDMTRAHDDADFYDEVEPETRRGTIDFGLLILRLGVGGLLLFHGLATFFGLGEGAGIGSLESEFTAQNFNFAGVLATAIPTIQIIAGGLLILGLATPLGASLALALSIFLTMFESARSGAGLAALGDDTAGIQGQLMLTIAALALQFTGPGRIGLDFSRGWAKRPLVSSWIFCVVAIAAAVAAWYFTTGSIPFMS
ncbi:MULTISPECIES: DoxX family protein [unclassified Corynebacterium]|uniref:DoxX family protein n=1 Tax=unclassified Corynebacterium TaxID=2624378 RepID=UPI0030A08D6E